MSSLTRPSDRPIARATAARDRLNALDRRANRALTCLCVIAAAVLFVGMVGIAYQVVNGAAAAIGRYGIAFLGHTRWDPALAAFGAWPLIYGSLITSVVSLVLTAAIGISIGIFLGRLAPPPVTAVIGPMVELLAAIPSVVVGLIGIIVIAPFSQSTIEPLMHSLFGWVPIFGQVPSSGQSIFTASLVLTIMVLPIVAALSRDLFLTVPRELTDGAEALGATRWEVIRGIVLPTTMPGLAAACVLGFGRAIGEAIAVSQVIGGSPSAPRNLFLPGSTMAATIATQFASPASALHQSSLLYLALILFVIVILTNLLAQRIAGWRRV